jgi:hypothetical protein
VSRIFLFIACHTDSEINLSLLLCGSIGSRRDRRWDNMPVAGGTELSQVKVWRRTCL